MKKFATVFFITTATILFYSCKKEGNIIPSIKTELPFQMCVIEEARRPGLSITATVLNPLEVQIMWTKKGKERYTVQRKGSDGVWTNRHTCSCNYFRDILPNTGTYSYRVLTGNTVSNVVTISTSTPPPPPPATIKIAFDPHYIDYWNAFLMDTTLLGSGLVQWQRDYIMNGLRLHFIAYNLTFVTEGEASQIAVLTESSEWYGSAGGVAFVGSYGQPDMECFVFTKLLQYNTEYILKALIHELGHTLNLHHTQNLSLFDNWMSYVYSIQQRFYEVYDMFGNLVNQPEVIRQTLQ